MKIATKISMSFLIIAVILTSAATSFFYAITRDNLAREIYSHLETTARSRAHRIDTILERELEALKLVTSRTQLRLSLDNYINKKDVTDKERLERILRDARSSTRSIRDIFIMNTAGKVIISTDKTLEGVDYSDEMFFKKGKEGNNLFLLPVGDNNASLYLSGPLVLENKLIGVLTIVASPDVIFSAVMDRTGLGKTGEVYLVNEDGYMITPSRFEENVLFRKKVDTKGYREGVEAAKKFGEKEHLRKPSVYKDYRGRSVLGVHDYTYGLKWLLLAEIDEEEVLAPLDKIKNYFIGGLIVIPLVAWLLGLYVSKIIAKPIARLHEGTEIIGRGDLDYKVDTGAKDEIGQLSKAFDKMTENLKNTTASRNELAREVEMRTRAEEKIKAAAEEWERTFNAISDLVFIQDKDFNIIKANKAFAEALKLKPEDIVGKKCYEIVHDKNTPWATCPLEKTRLDKKPHTEEVDDPHVGCPLLITTSPIFDDKGEVSGSVHIAKDISEQKKLEKLKDQFVNTVSHELRTPLALIKQRIYSIKGKIEKKTDGEEQKKFVDAVDKNIDRLHHLINNILDYQKLSAEKMTFEPEIGNINELVEETREEMLPLTENKGLKLSISLAKDLPEIRFDRSRIVQVLMNLVNNAVKFTEKGGIEIVTSRSEDGVRVSIKDTGIGIKKEDMNKLFESFSQIHAEDGAKPKGTGLGLAICKKIIEQHGGNIWVESEYGKGSTFIFSLPL